MLHRPVSGLQLCAGEREFDNFQLVEKTYIPDDDQSGGVLSNLDEEIEVRGPLGEIEYRGNGSFIVEGKKMHFSWVTLILGGSGITSGYQLIARTLETEGDSTGIAVIGANKSEADILSKEDLQLFKGNWESMEDNPGLSRCSAMLVKGHVNADSMKRKRGVSGRP